MTRTAYPVLSQAQLNRATLSRQLLLEPAKLGAMTAIERIGGLQAQEPASPYIGLWTRLAAFDARALDRAFADRTVVKATLMRGTLHAVGAADYRNLMPAVLTMLQGIRRQDRVQPPAPERLAELMVIAAGFTGAAHADRVRDPGETCR
jgi:hypothetical protein